MINYSILHILSNKYSPEVQSSMFIYTFDRCVYILVYIVSYSDTVSEYHNTLTGNQLSKIQINIEFAIFIH
jgi:hypothetical protein